MTLFCIKLPFKIKVIRYLLISCTPKRFLDLKIFVSACPFSASLFGVWTILYRWLLAVKSVTTRRQKYAFEFV
jgi:hypothetical protein